MKQLSQEPQYKISWGNLKQVSVRALVWEEKMNGEHRESLLELEGIWEAMWKANIVKTSYNL